MSQLVEQRREDGIVILTLSVPERRNAISLEMRKQLARELRAACADSACRAIVLTGAGGNFCSGGEVKPVNGGASSPDPQGTRRNVAILHEIVRMLVAGPKPTVAAVEGFAYGAGFSLAAACDHLVAAAGAKFCASFGRIGLMADAGLIWSLSQRVGASHARNILLTGRVVEAEDARQMGLANTLTGPGQALDAALEAAREMTHAAPLATAAMKAVLARGPLSLETVLAAEADLQPMLTMSQDYVEGRAAFRERRPPVFRGV